MGHFAETIWGRGRRATEIPGPLRDILDTTYRDGTDYVVHGRAEDPQAQEIVRYGRIYANRKGLSFRYVFTQDARLRFRLSDKRSYTKKNRAYWDNP